MITLEAENANALFLEILRAVKDHGKSYTRRGGQVLELGPMQCVLTNPNKNVIVLPHRKNNFFATLFETLWVLAGENSIETLKYFLPRAADFSDDGKIWRGAYGPRLRKTLYDYDYWVNHHYPDLFKGNQLYKIVEMLRADPFSRRAIVSIYDQSDTEAASSKDIPCNVALHFISRDGMSLDLQVWNRSNDAIWGFSGINLFEWTTLLQIIAPLAGFLPGKYYHFSSNMHVYEKHWKMMGNILDAPGWSGIGLPYIVTSYLSGDVRTHKKSFNFPVSVEEEYVSVFRVIDDLVKNHIPRVIRGEHGQFEGPADLRFLAKAFILLGVYITFKNNGEDGKAVEEAVQELQVNYLPHFGWDSWVVSALEFLTRNSRSSLGRLVKEEGLSVERSLVNWLYQFPY